MRSKTYRISDQFAKLEFNVFDQRDLPEKSLKSGISLFWAGNEFHLSEIDQEMANILIKSATGSDSKPILSQLCKTLTEKTKIYNETGLTLTDQSVTVEGTNGKLFNWNCILYDNVVKSGMAIMISSK